MTDNTVEGYSNYATFGVAVVLDNDRNLIAHVQGGLVRLREEAPNHPNVAGAGEEAIWTEDQAWLFETMDFLKELAQELAEQGEPSLLGAQMIQAGLAEVNWRELAEGYIGELRLQS